MGKSSRFLCIRYIPSFSFRRIGSGVEGNLPTFQFYSSRLMRKIDCYIETWLKSSNFVNYRRYDIPRMTKKARISVELSEKQLQYLLRDSTAIGGLIVTTPTESAFCAKLCVFSNCLATIHTNSTLRGVDTNTPPKNLSSENTAKTAKTEITLPQRETPWPLLLD